MPVFGKGRAKRPRKPLKFQSRWIPERARRYGDEYQWPVTSTPIHAISRLFNINIVNWIARRKAETKKPVRVLDWGCGDGVAIHEIASEFKSGVEAYGYADESHPEWSSSSNVKFIERNAERSLRYFKNGSLDLIYSHMGLTHLNNGSTGRVRFKEYVTSLAAKLTPGGLLVTDCPMEFGLNALRKWKIDGFTLSVRPSQLDTGTNILSITREKDSTFRRLNSWLRFRP